MTFSLPEIQVSPNLYTSLQIIFIVAGLIIVAFNVLPIAVSALPPNTTDWSWGQEFIDDNLEEGEEENDEEEHEEESDEEK